MSTYYGDAVITTGEYTDQAGQTKKRYCKIGAMFYNSEHDSYSLKLEALPMPQPDGCWVKIFKKDQNSAAPQQAPQSFQQQPPAPQYQQPAQSFQAPPMAPTQSGNVVNVPF